MTKKEMITKIRKAENQAREELYSASRRWGDDDEYTYYKRFAWGALYELLKTLGLENMRERELNEIKK